MRCGSSVKKVQSQGVTTVAQDMAADEAEGSEVILVVTGSKGTFTLRKDAIEFKVIDLLSWLTP